MLQEYFKTDLGIVIKDNDSIRLKSCYKKTIISEEDFIKSNPVKIKKHKYLEELNLFFKNDKFSWTHDHTEFRKLDNFEYDKWKVSNYNNLNDVPMHDIGKSYLGLCFIVMYHGRLYYTFFSANYFPQMQLVDFHTKSLTAKWTHIKNLAPVFNCGTKTII